MKIPLSASLSIRGKAIIALVVCATLWSMGGLMIKLVNLNPVAIAGIRSLFAAIIMFLVCRRPKFDFSPMQIGAALMYTGTVLLFVMANKMTTSANAILLQYTAPIYAAILGFIFLREKVNIRDVVAIIVILGGMCLFFVDDLNSGGLLGNVLAILSGICFSAQAIFMKLQKTSSPTASIILGNIITFVVSIPFLFADAPTPGEITVLAIMGIFQLGLAYVLYSYAVTKLSALEMVLIPIVEPILNPIWVVIFTGEIPGTMAIIGGVIVIGAVIVKSLTGNKKQLELELNKG